MCAIIRTCDRKKAGTDDKVSIAFKNVEDAVLISAAYPSYDDNERGKETAYGKTFQGYDPFESFADREFRVEKGKDGEYGGWCLENVDFYFFSPGKSFVADSEAPESFYEASYAPDGDDMWLKDDDLTTEWIAIYGMEDLPYDWETLGSIR